MQMTLTAEPEVVAVVYTPDGELYDRCYSWQAGQTYANRQFIVQAVNPDGYMNEAEAQELYDWERDCSIDCFGEGVLD